MSIVGGLAPVLPHNPSNLDYPGVPSFPWSHSDDSQTWASLVWIKRKIREMMKYNKADGRWLNLLLKGKVFEERTITSEEVKMTLGLDIKEVVMCWLFEHKNSFRMAVKEWSKKGARMNYKEIQGY